MGLPSARVYRNVELRQQIFGLEQMDAVVLGFLTFVLMLANRHGVAWNVVVLLIAYAGLRVYKRGKPEGYLMTLGRFYFRRPFFSAAASDTEGAAHPFPFADTESPQPSSRRHP
jgi:hypothetical protein